MKFLLLIALIYLVYRFAGPLGLGGGPRDTIAKKKDNEDDFVDYEEIDEE